MYTITSRRLSLSAIMLAVVFLYVGCAAPGGTAATEGTWIDVRTADEYAQGHVSFALNLPHDEIANGVAELGLPRDEPIYLYCGSGRRAGLALEALEAAGYSRVVNLGGIDDALARAGEGSLAPGTEPAGHAPASD